MEFCKSVFVIYLCSSFTSPLPSQTNHSNHFGYDNRLSCWINLCLFEKRISKIVFKTRPRIEVLVVRKKNAVIKTLKKQKRIIVSYASSEKFQ